MRRIPSAICKRSASVAPLVELRLESRREMTSMPISADRKQEDDPLDASNLDLGTNRTLYVGIADFGDLRVFASGIGSEYYDRFFLRFLAEGSEISAI